MLLLLARTEIERLQRMDNLFVEHDDLIVENFVDSIANTDLQIVGSELILGKIYQKIGFPEDGSCNYFRNLVLCRIVYPCSKLKTVKYFQHHLNLNVSVYSLYRFLDELESGLKQAIEDIAFNNTKEVLHGKIGVVFYSSKRSLKERKNREKGLKRLEKKVNSGKLSKKHINNRGYK